MNQNRESEDYEQKQRDWEWQLERIKQQFYKRSQFPSPYASLVPHSKPKPNDCQQILLNFNRASNFKRNPKQNAWVINFDMRQFDPESIHVNVNEDSVVVQGQRVTNGLGRHISRKEFYRKVALPPGVTADDVTSKLSSNGMLLVQGRPAPPSYMSSLERIRKSRSSSDHDWTMDDSFGSSKTPPSSNVSSRSRYSSENDSSGAWEWDGFNRSGYSLNLNSSGELEISRDSDDMSF